MNRAQYIIETIDEYYGGEYEHPSYSQHQSYGGGMYHHPYHPSMSMSHQEPSYSSHEEEPVKKPKSRTKAFLGGVALGAGGVIGAAHALTAAAGA